MNLANNMSKTETTGNRIFFNIPHFTSSKLLRVSIKSFQAFSIDVAISSLPFSCSCIRSNVMTLLTASITGFGAEN